LPYTQQKKDLASVFLSTLFPSQEDRLRVHSREHAMRSDSSIRLKRDDELSAGISGSKLRKLLFIVNKLSEENKTRCYIECGYNSNNALASAQILAEKGIEAVFIIKKRSRHLQIGNGGYFSLFNPNCIDEKPKNIEKNAEFIPEGCLTMYGILGAASLLFDHVINGKKTQTIHIDSGSGASAIATILAASLLELDIHIIVHSAYDEKGEFQSKLTRYSAPFFTFFGYQAHTAIISYSFNQFPCGKSFGSFPATIKKTIHFFAELEGVIFDPLYSAKLLHAIASKPSFAMHHEYIEYIEDSLNKRSRSAHHFNEQQGISNILAKQSDKASTRELQYPPKQCATNEMGIASTLARNSLVIHGGGIISLSGFFPL